MNRDTVGGTIKLLALLLAAVLIGACVALGVAWLIHEVAVAAIGQEGIEGIDDTLRWRLLSVGVYLSGMISGIVFFALGWRLFLSSPGSSSGDIR
jgi:hypothetical protein